MKLDVERRALVRVNPLVDTALCLLAETFGRMSRSRVQLEIRQSKDYLGGGSVLNGRLLTF